MPKGADAKLNELVRKLTTEKGYSIYDLVDVVFAHLDEELEEVMFSDPEIYDHEKTHIHFYACQARGYFNGAIAAMREVKARLPQDPPS